MSVRSIVLICFLLLSGAGTRVLAMEFSQEFFRKHLLTNSYAVDTEASAVVLFESVDINIGTEYRGKILADVQTETVHRVLRILKPDALKEANIILVLRKDGRNFYISKLTASTYNLSGDEIVETKIKPDDIYEKELSEHYYEYNFSMPGVKEGSIIEYSYERTSPVEPYFPRWNVQGKYPKLKSEYSISFPDRLEFTTITHVRDTAKKYETVNEAENSAENFCKTRREVFNDGKRYEALWVKNNEPAIKAEPYVNTLANYMEYVEFKLTAYLSRTGTKHVENTWEKFTEEFLARDDFGKAITASNHFLDPVIDSIKGKYTFPQERISAIYDFVRANFKSNGKKGLLIKDDLKSVFQDRVGTPGEINLLLTAMLLKAGISAAPLILNTMGNLSPSPVLPVAGRFNYTACAVTIDSNFIFLDASDPNNEIGILPAYCYNGYARIIKKDGVGVNLTTNLLQEKSFLSVKLTDVTDTGAHVEIVERCGLVRSSELRKAWAKNEHGQKHYVDEIAGNLPAGMTIKDSSVENVQRSDTNLIIKFTGILRYKKNEQGSIYLNTTFVRHFTKNPFRSDTRTLPIEYPHQLRYRYNLTIMLPGDMEPSDLPKATYLDIEHSGLLYSKLYNFNKELHLFTVNSDFSVTGCSYPAESYQRIRSFYGDMINTDNEMITLKSK